MKGMESCNRNMYSQLETKRKTHSVNILMQNLDNKNDTFWTIFADVFLTFSPSIDCGYLLELPRRIATSSNDSYVNQIYFYIK